MTRAERNSNASDRKMTSVADFTSFNISPKLPRFVAYTGKCQGIEENTMLMESLNMSEKVRSRRYCRVVINHCAPYETALALGVVFQRTPTTNPPVF